ncbi:MAG: Alpha/Beta hydrolase protein [Monoraphidium minutum]|nr:MAG: Alpha/Beta hydrolase protein [Monoraphidium minutum]
MALFLSSKRLAGVSTDVREAPRPHGGAPGLAERSQGRCAPACAARRRSIVLAPLLAAGAAAATALHVPHAAAAALEYEVDGATGLRRVKYTPEGWRYWSWRGRRVHYIEAGAANTGTPVVLVHGYGASAYHWRYQIPALEAAGHRVYAICLLGFGYSEKAITEYSGGGLWAEQLRDFIGDVVNGRGGGGGGEGAADNGGGGGAPERVVLAGNSLGGYASLVAAARHPELVAGLMLLNSAGPLKGDDEDDPSLDDAAASASEPWYQPLADAAKRVVLFFAFQRARQPERIKEVLGMVYSNDASIDDDLVESIRVPATDPNASEVFYRINTAKGTGTPPSVNALFRKLRAAQLPTLLLWGEQDPWITSSRADRLQRLYPEAVRVSLAAGHCPHDDAPAEASAAMVEWLRGLKA